MVEYKGKRSHMFDSSIKTFIETGDTDAVRQALELLLTLSDTVKTVDEEKQIETLAQTLAMAGDDPTNHWPRLLHYQVLELEEQMNQGEETVFRLDELLKAGVEREWKSSSKLQFISTTLESLSLNVLPPKRLWMVEWKSCLSQLLLKKKKDFPLALQFKTALKAFHCAVRAGNAKAMEVKHTQAYKIACEISGPGCLVRHFRRVYHALKDLESGATQMREWDKWVETQHPYYLAYVNHRLNGFGEFFLAEDEELLTSYPAPKSAWRAFDEAHWHLDRVENEHLADQKEYILDEKHQYFSEEMLVAKALVDNHGIKMKAFKEEVKFFKESFFALLQWDFPLSGRYGFDVINQIKVSQPGCRVPLVAQVIGENSPRHLRAKDYLDWEDYSRYTHCQKQGWGTRISPTWSKRQRKLFSLIEEALSNG